MGMPQTIHHFTVDEYHRMGQAGIFHEDDRVELIHGQIVQMTPIGPRHAACVKRLLALFAVPTAGRATLSAQDPVVLDVHVEPQPDVALLRHRGDGYQTALPGAEAALLVIEVADSSLTDDRAEKIPLYAEAGIREAWLVNLPDDVLEIYRAPHAGTYTEVRTAQRGETIGPLAFPDVVVPVDDILGRPPPQTP